MQFFRRVLGFASGSYRPTDPTNYRIGHVDLALPDGHALPLYQRQFRLYDRFLPLLGSETLPGWIIDVGANCGDSAAAFVSSEPKRILCIEPVKQFYDALERNVRALEANGSRVIIDRIAVSRYVSSVSIQADQSTAKVSNQASSETVQAAPLDEIIRKHCKHEIISFIKIDVDGSDADVIMSGQSTISQFRPPIYFECDVVRRVVPQFLEAFDFLSDLGYAVTAFDNFGMPLAELQNRKMFEQILDYLVHLAERCSKRTIYYIDCFAYQRNCQMCHELLDRYSTFANNVK